MKLVATMTNHKLAEDSISASDSPILTYECKGHPILLNDWDNSDFFTAAFPTLFPFGVGGHIIKKDESRQTIVSLQPWAKWALSHIRDGTLICISVEFS